MAFRTDNGGYAFKSSDLKLTTISSTWGTRLSQLSRQVGIVRIITYSLPNREYAKKQLGRRPTDIFIIAHEKFEKQAREIKTCFPKVRIAVASDIHSKILLIEPKTIWISSANFGDSGWQETTIGIRSEEALNWYVKQIYEPLWNHCREILLQ